MEAYNIDKKYWQKAKNMVRGNSMFGGQDASCHTSYFNKLARNKKSSYDDGHPHSLGQVHHSAVQGESD